MVTTTESMQIVKTQLIWKRFIRWSVVLTYVLPDIALSNRLT